MSDIRCSCFKTSEILQLKLFKFYYKNTNNNTYEKVMGTHSGIQLELYLNF